jgi:hypothetical protein
VPDVLLDAALVALDDAALLLLDVALAALDALDAPPVPALDAPPVPLLDAPPALPPAPPLEVVPAALLDVAAALLLDEAEVNVLTARLLPHAPAADTARRGRSRGRARRRSEVVIRASYAHASRDRIRPFASSSLVRRFTRRAARGARGVNARRPAPEEAPGVAPPSRSRGRPR